MRLRALIAGALALTLIAGPAAAQSPSQAAAGTPQGQGSVNQFPLLPPENLERIREAVNREPAIRIENGRLKIYVEVIGNWPTFAEASKGFDFLYGPSAKGANPMSHQEFVSMMTPRDMYSSVGIKPAEVATMAAVNAIGQWAIVKALSKIARSRKEKQLRDIRAQIEAELAAIKKQP
jgi:hypothetical protein